MFSSMVTAKKLGFSVARSSLASHVLRHRISAGCRHNSTSTSSTSSSSSDTSSTSFKTPTRASIGLPIDESAARKSAALLALHARLELGDKFAFSTLARALVSGTANVQFMNNEGMSHFGKNLLSFYVHEYFMIKYPRLPPNVLRHVVKIYTSVDSLAKLGRSWGVEADTSSPFTRYISDKSETDLLGKLIYTEASTVKEDGVVEISKGPETTDLNGAMGHFVRALVAGVHAHGGIESSKTFIHKFIIQPRKLDIASIMAFDQPTRELAVLCAREGLERPISRLMSETGRYSKAPVFVVGVFSGNRKMGEGQGASLKEARTRAAVHALKSWYLYSPVNAKLPSDEEFKGVEYVDSGVVIV